MKISKLANAYVLPEHHVEAEEVPAGRVMSWLVSESRILKIGYSDSARVFVNGELRYAGDNTYQSRDYRYLGTIGLFDSVVLPLSAGENEILIAVTEAFGGWGVMTEFESLEGITVLNAR